MPPEVLGITERIRRRALWESLSDRARYFISWSSINHQIPIDVIAELVQKGCLQHVDQPQKQGYALWYLDAVDYGYRTGEAYDYNRHDGKHYPFSHIAAVDIMHLKMPLDHWLLKFNWRIRWALWQAGLVTVGDVLRFRQQHGPDWYKEVKGIGPAYAREVDTVLAIWYDLSLPIDP